jgi:hypothetical protein
MALAMEAQAKLQIENNSMHMGNPLGKEMLLAAGLIVTMCARSDASPLFLLHGLGDTGHHSVQ